MEKLDYKYNQFKNASARLEEALSLDFPTPETKVDAVIRRFGFTTELFWKFLKALLEDKGISVNASPVDVIRVAKSASVIGSDDTWIALVHDRNLTSHIYDESTATTIYTRVKDTYAKMFSDFIEKYAESI